MSEGTLYSRTRELTAILAQFERNEVPESLLARFRSDEAFAQRVAGFMKDGGSPPASLIPAAFKAAGVKVFGPEDWETFFPVKLTAEQWEAAGNFPWPDLDPLAKSPIWAGGDYVKDHFLFFGLDRVHGVDERDLPLDLRGVWEFTRDWAHWKNRPMLGRSRWTSELSPSATVQGRWYLVATHPNSHPSEPGEYEVPSAAECLLAQVLYFQKYSGLPRYSIYSAGGIRCSEVVDVSSLPPGEERLLERYNGHGFSDVIGVSGLAEARLAVVLDERAGRLHVVALGQDINGHDELGTVNLGHSRKVN